MIGILGGMGTQAGLDFCTKLAKLNRGKIDQNYPLFLLYNKSNIPDRKQNLRRYNKVLKSLVDGCKFLEKNKCKFVSIPCNTAHYWYEDLKKRIKIPILNMPETVYLNTKRNCKKNSKKGCNNKSTKCITHNLWDQLDQHINGFFENVRLQDLSKTVEK